MEDIKKKRVKVLPPHIKQYNLRLPINLHSKIKAIADIEGYAVNHEIILALELYTTIKGGKICI